jgi:ABC-type transport system involved in multi-copper enzyme maturation permease subunit
VTSLLSWPIGRATARERGLSAPVLITAAVLVLLAMLRTGGLAAAAWFTGFSEFWLFLLALLLGAGALSSEVQSGHAQLVLLRPITRAQWVGGRLAGVTLVFCGAGAAAWGVALVLSLARGDAALLGLRLALLPAALLPHLGWLATLVALSALLPGWTNAGVLLAIRLGWFFGRTGLPLLLPQWDLAPWLSGADHYFGPQAAFADGVVKWERLLWDVLWISLAWLAAVLLFNRRELARRRA